MGAYVTKLAAFPDAGNTPPAMAGTTSVDVAEAVAARIAAGSLVFTIAAQLRTDADTMPIEDARMRWPEDASPYRPVGCLVFDALPARDSHCITAIEALSFAPGHSLKAHRPLGAIARARLNVYRSLADER